MGFRLSADYRLEYHKDKSICQHQDKSERSMKLQTKLHNNTFKVVMSVPATPKQNHKNVLYMVITLSMSLTKYQTITFIVNVSD